MNVLVSSAGRRGALVRIWQRDLRALVPEGRVIAVDVSPYSAAAQLADAAELVPRCTSDEFMGAVLDVCHRHEVGLIVPTIDTELPAYAAAADELAAAGVTVSVPSPEAVRVGADKAHTYEWLVAQGFPTVATTTPADALAEPDRWPFPLIVKPRAGSSSEGVSVAHTRDDLIQRATEADLVAQELAPGVEYTADAFVDRSGVCRCVVLRQRLEVRAGEVSKGLTVRWPEAEQIVTEVAQALPGAYGAITVQFFATPGQIDSVRIIEINPRYGGGYPLSWEAGAHFPRWTLEELLGLPSTAAADGWRDGLVMLRYDDAVFVDEADLRR